MRWDCLIRNGRVFDGLGKSRMLDIGILDGRITDLAPHLEGAAEQTIDATGQWVTPGFVDIHTHYDLEVEIAPALSESVRHGITSVVMGGCSLSTTYGDPEELAYLFSRVETLPPELIQGWLRSAQPWPSPRGYFKHLNQLPLGPNIACMLGHSALRVKVMGLERSLKDHATPAEIEQMRALAEEALEAGCIGISVDLVHWHKVSGPYAGRALPSHHAAFAEIAMMADVCRQRDAVFQVTPNPQNPWTFLNILRLSPGIWRAPLRNTILSALDMDGAPHLWRVFPAILFVFNHLLGCNIRFQTLSEPFTIYADGHLTPFFEEFEAGVLLNNCRTREERAALWNRPGFRQDFIRSWTSPLPKTFHRNLARMRILSCPDASLNGKSIAQAAHDANRPALDFFMDLLAEHDEALRWVACSANRRENVRHRLMAHPQIFPGFSDAGAHSRNLAFFDNALSIIREAARTGFMPVEKAVARVTGEAAQWFNLDTGVIQVGARADLVLLDPERLCLPIPEPAPLSDPVLSGAMRMVKRDPHPAVHQVLIQGVPVVLEGEPLPVLGSQPLGAVLTQLNPARNEAESLARHRNRISDQQAVPTTLATTEDYWTIFLLKHRHPGNVAFHCVGFVIMYALPLLAVLDANPWWMALMPFSQLTGLLGHWWFEPTPIDQRDTVFSWRAFLCLHRMFLAVLMGQYPSELTRASRYVRNAELF